MDTKTCFKPADILLPQGIALETWSVVACDQYTSQPNYWKEVEAIVGESPSSYHIILPEAYLEKGDREGQISKINQTMQQYLDSGLFACLNDRFIYVERQIGNGLMRRGLIGKIDLMEYDYHVGAQSLVRATEKTVLDRIPPRVQIREHAPLEIPHIMLLVDDPERTVVEPVSSCKSPETQLYQFELMQGGGEISGYLVPKEREVEIQQALCTLADPSVCAKKYHAAAGAPFVYAVGDGNHSLASAKECFEREMQGKSREERENLPSRYALVELVNIHDESLEFEPIHRVVFGSSLDELISAFCRHYPDAAERESGEGAICFLQNGIRRNFCVPSQENRLSVAVVQEFLDAYLSESGASLDYIHGEDVVEQLSMSEDTVGILLPEMKKSDLFQTVLVDGSLPRKTFSMGSAHEKRFYLEARSLREE